MLGPLITALLMVIAIISIAASYHAEYRKREKFVNTFHLTENDIKKHIKYYDD